MHQADEDFTHDSLFGYGNHGASIGLLEQRLDSTAGRRRQYATGESNVYVYR
jgi:hypothetical protein